MVRQAEATPAPAPAQSDAKADEAIEAVRKALAGLRFGSIALTIHESVIVQMEITEKRRF